MYKTFVYINISNTKIVNQKNFVRFSLNTLNTQTFLQIFILNYWNNFECYFHICTFTLTEKKKSFYYTIVKRNQISSFHFREVIEGLEYNFERIKRIEICIVYENKHKILLE